MSQIGGAIRKRRQDLGLTQEALARRAGVSLRLINRIESGETQDPRYSTFKTLVNALDVQLSEFLEGIGE